MPDSEPAHWRRGADRSLLHTRVFDVRASAFTHPHREGSKEFIVIDAPSWAVVAPVTPSGELVMVRQYRFGAEAVSLELPGGVVEPGENPLVAALRELAEETGYAGREAIELGRVYPNPAIQSNQAHMILIPDVRLATETSWDPDEEIQTSLVPIADVLRAAREGEITHALMLNMLFFLEPWWRDRWPAQAEI